MRNVASTPLALFLATLLSSGASAQCPQTTGSWGSRLGFGTKKVLIVHADDAGSFLGANSAVDAMLADKTVDSASVMVPAPYYNEMVGRYNQAANLGTEWDLGLHLTVNSRDNYRWVPVYVPWTDVKRILKRKFLFWGARDYFPSGAFFSWFYRGPQALKRELEAQIEAAQNGRAQTTQVTALVKMEPPPTHVDSHVGAVFVRKSHFKRYMFASHDKGVPAVTFKNWDFTIGCMGQVDNDHPMHRLAGWLSDRQRDAQKGFPDWPYPRLDQYCTVPYGPDLDATRTKTAKMIENLPTGITQILFHPADEDAEIRSILAGKQADRRILIDRHLFSSQTPPEELDDQMDLVERTNWTKMMQRFGSPCSDPMDGQHWEAPACCP